MHPHVMRALGLATVAALGAILAFAGIVTATHPQSQHRISVAHREPLPATNTDVVARDNSEHQALLADRLQARQATAQAARQAAA
ncbi:MAG: hypothetical protein M3024_09890, partial [Candidatus Dormibacteraeota bacterium]|nr:hypothetical protein [Candidatus Dormibacteraeota bacterium]